MEPETPRSSGLMCSLHQQGPRKKSLDRSRGCRLQRQNHQTIGAILMAPQGEDNEEDAEKAVAPQTPAVGWRWRMWGQQLQFISLRGCFWLKLQLSFVHSLNDGTDNFPTEVLGIDIILKGSSPCPFSFSSFLPSKEYRTCFKEDIFVGSSGSPLYRKATSLQRNSMQLSLLE